jgi:hypothetical protein
MQLKKVGLPAAQTPANVMQLFQRKKGRPMKSNGRLELDPTYPSVQKFLRSLDKKPLRVTRAAEGQREEMLDWIQAETTEKSEVERHEFW